MKPAIIIPAISAFVEEGRDHVRGVRDSQALESAYAIKLNESRDDAKARRVRAGHFLAKVRASLPKRSATNEGWKAFLEAIELDDSTAHNWMDEADPSRLTARSKNSQAGSAASDDRPSPVRTDEDAPPESTVDRDDDGALVAGSAASAGEASAIEPDRNTWCTPAWLAAALGDWDLDPCSNERSHIRAAREFRWERSEDGLFMASSVDASARVFVNPPYARQQVIRWVRAYAHTRFCFLLKFDPSTEWFATLLENTRAILIPKGTRIEFEAPPGVPPEKAGANQFPHALFYAHAEDATPAILDACLPLWRIR